MRVVSQVGTFVLAMLLFVSLAMACFVPMATLTRAERDCCEHMAADCGDAQMPASHSCCHRLLPPGSGSYVASEAYQLPSHSLQFGIVPDIAVLEGQEFSPALQRDWFYETHSPPESPPIHLVVLRI